MNCKWTFNFNIKKYRNSKQKCCCDCLTENSLENCCNCCLYFKNFGITKTILKCVNCEHCKTFFEK